MNYYKITVIIIVIIIIIIIIVVIIVVAIIIIFITEYDTLKFNLKENKLITQHYDSNVESKYNVIKFVLV